jgi:hypothetical protein
MYICGQICKETQGSYTVSKNENHFQRLLLNHIQPPIIFHSNQEVCTVGFLKVGFPQLILQSDQLDIHCFW